MSHNLEAILLLIKDLNTSDLSLLQIRLNHLLSEQKDTYPTFDALSCALRASNRVPDEDDYDHDSIHCESVTKEQLDRELNEMVYEREMYYKLREELMYHFKLI